MSWLEISGKKVNGDHPNQKVAVPGITETDIVSMVILADFMKL